MSEVIYIIAALSGTLSLVRKIHFFYSSSILDLKTFILYRREKMVLFVTATNMKPSLKPVACGDGGGMLAGSEDV